MRIRRPRLWIALFSALGVASVALVDVGRTSPGPLSAVHQRESSLEGRGGCADCHGGWGTSMAEACLECHGTIGAELELGEGLHGVLGEQAALGCARCHSDHHGAGFAIVNARSFSLAGITNQESFDHSFVGFMMDGAHLELDCGECHTHIEAEVLPKGELRFGGLDQDCATCHDDPHEGSMILDCAQCHGQEEFDRLDSLRHERFASLIGGHAALACDDCHETDTPRELERLGTGHDRLPDRDCASCHHAPHGDPFLAQLAQRTGVTDGATCGACHLGDHESFADDSLTVSSAQHASSGFSLGVPHEGVACAECHDPGLPLAERYPGRGRDDCAECHGDPHAGQFSAGAFAARGCVECHVRHEFEPSTFDVEQHALARMALESSHADLDCDACHQPAHADGVVVFRGTPRRCEECHADAHQGLLDPFLANEPEMDQGECARCHQPTRFDDVEADLFDHERWTGFTLEGAHAQAECAACHPGTKVPDEAGRTFGFAGEHFGRVEGCDTCHVDPHRGEFDEPGRPTELEGRASCARCHETSSFRAFPRTFAHGLWTGFSLAGRHADVGCAACHTPTAPDELGRTWEPAIGSDCADCHADPHAGQFKHAGAVDCLRCHRSAASFAELFFDHDRDSRFALGDAHADVECSACHESWPLGGGGEVVRYRPLDRDCVDCHGEHDRRIRNRGGR